RASTSRRSSTARASTGRSPQASFTRRRSRSATSSAISPRRASRFGPSTRRTRERYGILGETAGGHPPTACGRARRQLHGEARIARHAEGRAKARRGRRRARARGRGARSSTRHGRGGRPRLSLVAAARVTRPDARRRRRRARAAASVALMREPLPTVLIPGLLCTPRLYAEQIPALWGFGSVTVADHTRDDSMAGIARRILAQAPPKFALIG